MIQDGLLGNKPVTLVVIDLESDKVVNTVKLGYDAVRFNTSEDGNRGYLIHSGKIWRGTPSVVVVETKTGTIVAQADIKKEPTDFFLNNSGDGLIFVHKGLTALKVNRSRQRIRDEGQLNRGQLRGAGDSRKEQGLPRRFQKTRGTSK